ncbi:hypothetical protein GN956_G23535 [Arapaima gigas]
MGVVLASRSQKETIRNLRAPRLRTRWKDRLRSNGMCDFDQGQIRNVESFPGARTTEPLLGVRMNSGVVLTSETSPRMMGTISDSPVELSALEAADHNRTDTRLEENTAVLGLRAKVTREEVCGDGTDEREEQGVKRGLVEECPICTDSYESSGGRGRAMLNCDHAVCRSCLDDMQKHAADGSRACCPLCRQKTPLLSWEIRRMQEETMSLMGASYARSGAAPATSLTPPPPPAEPGTWAALERRLDSRIETATVCGCFSYPPGLVRGIRRLRLQCHCCYSAGLLLLYLVEISCLLLVFLPVLVLVLLFTLANK